MLRRSRDESDLPVSEQSEVSSDAVFNDTVEIPQDVDEVSEIMERMYVKYSFEKQTRTFFRPITIKQKDFKMLMNWVAEANEAKMIYRMKLADAVFTCLYYSCPSMLHDKIKHWLNEEKREDSRLMGKLSKYVEKLYSNPMLQDMLYSNPMSQDMLWEKLAKLTPSRDTKMEQFNETYMNLIQQVEPKLDEKTVASLYRSKVKTIFKSLVFNTDGLDIAELQSRVTRWAEANQSSNKRKFEQNQIPYAKKRTFAKR